MVLNFSTLSTGPKISSLAIFMLSLTSVNSVGSMKYDWSPALPPVTSLAPSLLPASMKPSTRWCWMSSTMGCSEPALLTLCASGCEEMAVPASFTNASYTDSCTYTREPAQHTWPALKNKPIWMPATAFFRSASGNTMAGLLPPSSTVTFLRLESADACMIFLPTAVEPVNAILSTSMCMASAWPAEGQSLIAR